MHSNQDQDHRKFDRSDEMPDDRIVYETPRGEARQRAPAGVAPGAPEPPRDDTTPEDTARDRKVPAA